jgi:hypothetical protein
MNKPQAAENESTALVSATRDSLQGQSLLPAVVESVLGQLGAKALHNFQGDNMERWRMQTIACGPGVKSGPDAREGVIALRHFYAHRVEMVDDATGEINDGVRVVLIDPEEHAYGFVSDGIARDLGAIISTFGMGPYIPPINVRIKEIQTRKGRRTYTIVPA